MIGVLHSINLYDHLKVFDSLGGTVFYVPVSCAGSHEFKSWLNHSSKLVL